MTVVDTFNRADSSSSMGTTSDGTGTWVALHGTGGISSNQAYSPSLGTGSYTVADCGVSVGADGAWSITLGSDPVGCGVAFRIGAANNFWVVYVGNTGKAILSKMVSGALNDIGSLATVVTGDVLTGVTSGTSVVFRLNGSTVTTTTDSFQLSATDAGVFFGATGARVDSMTLTPATSTFYARPIKARRTQAVMRAAVR